MHYHVIGRWANKKFIDNARDFDVAGRHPNIKNIKASIVHHTRVYNYVCKEGDVTGEMTLAELGGKADRHAVFQEAVQSSSTADECLNTLKESATRDFFMGFNNVRAAAQYIFPKEEEYDQRSRYEFSDENLPRALIEWRDEVFGPNPPDRPKTLILVGPTRMGKTQWSRSLGNVCYWENMIDLRLLRIRDNATPKEYIVLSDVPKNKIGDRWVWEHYDALFKGQEDLTMTDKYVPKQMFRWGKPFIYLCNTFDYNDIYDTPYAANFVVVEINEPLF